MSVVARSARADSERRNEASKRAKPGDSEFVARTFLLGTIFHPMQRHALPAHCKCITREIKPFQ